MWGRSNQIAELDVDVTITRIGCTEKDRSIILVSLTLPRTDDGITNVVRVPLVFGQNDEAIYPLRLSREPHSYLANSEYLVEGETGVFFLDAGYPYTMLPSQYNDEFVLHFVDKLVWYGNLDLGHTVTIPPYENQLLENSLPLSGRHSGLWVVPEVPDQGFLLSVNEFDSLHAGPLVIFLSWNTFDLDGDLLWLTGSTSFPVSSSEVSVDLILVENGEFLGSRHADRSIVGTIQLHARSCTSIEVNYDLDSIGLGSGDFTLTRPFNLEPAGFACQDDERRRMYD
jgi:hypothetical protein